MSDPEGKPVARKDLAYEMSRGSLYGSDRPGSVSGLAALLFLSAVFLLLSGIFCPLSANVFNSPHDLYNQGYLMPPEGELRSSPQCTLCHPVHDGSRPRVWDMIPESLDRYGAVGNVCASCHDGVSIVDRNVDAAITVFHPYSHGNDLEKAPDHTITTNTGLVSDDLGCNSCHDPHNEVIRPFLRLPIIGICTRCHKERGNTGYGLLNTSGNHPVDIEPFDNTEGASPIEVTDPFRTPFPQPYPARDGMLAKQVHWTLGGHLTFGDFGKIECVTCHSFHGLEGKGPVEALLSKDPVKEVANEFCEGCHRGERGDDNPQPPFPNPGGTTTGRTYHPVDDDEANGIGWIAAIADTLQLEAYEWGAIDAETDKPRLICTTCHVAHNGMENSPALVDITDEIENEGVETFCEICHRDPPVGHHGYEEGGFIDPVIAAQMTSNRDQLGHTYGQYSFNRVYCSHCHKAHNAGYAQQEDSFIPILVDQITDLCEICHSMGVSHFLGDSTLPSTYGKSNPPLYRDAWPETGLYSVYEGEGEVQYSVTCLSCHYLSGLPEGFDAVTNNRLLAPADENTEWAPGYPEDYLCTGCHGINPATESEGHTHPLMEADRSLFPTIFTSHLLVDEVPTTYTDNDGINCHSCHKTHNAIVRGGVYILKAVRGNNIDPKAIHPTIDYTKLCHGCHSADDY